MAVGVTVGCGDGAAVGCGVGVAAGGGFSLLTALANTGVSTL